MSFTALALALVLAAPPCLADDPEDPLFHAWREIQSTIRKQINDDNQRHYDGQFFGANPSFDPSHDDFDPEASDKYWVINPRPDHPNVTAIIQRWDKKGMPEEVRGYIEFAQGYPIHPTRARTSDPILFVNGIRTIFEGQTATAQLMSDAFGQPVLGLLNGSAVKNRGGSIVDVVQTALDRRGPSSTDGDGLTVDHDMNIATAMLKYTIISRVEQNWERQMRGEKRKPIYIVAHSQGGAIAARALDEANRVLIAERNALISKAKGLGVEVPDLIPLDIRDVRYLGFGNAAPEWPSGPGLGKDALGWYEHYLHVLDPTPIYLGLRNGTRNDPKKAGKWSRVIRFAGNPKSGTYWKEVETLAKELQAMDQLELYKRLAAVQALEFQKAIKERRPDLDSTEVRKRARATAKVQARQLVDAYWRDGRPTMEAAVELVRFANPDLMLKHVNDPVFHEVKPGSSWVANRVQQVDGEKFTLYHHVTLSYLKFWVQRNGLAGSRRPAFHDHPIWLDADTFRFLTSLELGNGWSLPIKHYDRRTDTLTLTLPAGFLTTNEIKRRTVQKFKTILSVPVPWGSKLSLPTLSLKPTHGKSWKGAWTGAKGRHELRLWNSGYFEMKVYDTRGKLLRSHWAWTKPL